MKVAILILNWNGKSDTLRCLESLSTSTHPGFQVYVLDNGSKVSEIEEIEKHWRQLGAVPPGRFTRSPVNLGFAGGMNALAQQALSDPQFKPDLILLLNNDTLPDSRFLEPLIQAATRFPSYGVFGSVVVTPDRPGEETHEPISTGWLNLWTGSTPFTHEVSDQDLAPCEFVHGCSFCVRADLWKSLGGLDEDYFAYYEESDFCRRAYVAGSGIAVVRASQILHEGSVSVNRFSGLQEFFMMRNRILFIRKNSAWFQKLIAFPYSVFVYGLKRSARAILYRQFSALKGVLLGLWFGFLGRKVDGVLVSGLFSKRRAA
ncbi:MAG: glycosyltransferase family 2 protein [Bdellovibrionales bacterium]|nr:glycosyltransferase family 2 protein [Bdellovibrionales bacterium]